MLGECDLGPLLTEMRRLCEILGASGHVVPKADFALISRGKELLSRYTDVGGSASQLWHCLCNIYTVQSWSKVVILCTYCEWQPGTSICFNDISYFVL